MASRWAVQRDETGHQVGVLEINRDITDRKQAEAERERLLAEVQQQAIVLQGINRIFQQALGASTEEELGQRSWR